MTTTTTTKSTTKSTAKIAAARALGASEGRDAAHDAYLDTCSNLARQWRDERDAARGWDEHSGEALSWHRSNGELATVAERRAYCEAYATAARERAVELFRETLTYRLEVSDDPDALVQSSRAGLWEAAPGESSGWFLGEALRAAVQLRLDGAAAVRLVCEQTGERREA